MSDGKELPDAKLHEVILDNQDADDETAEEAVRRAIDEDGMSVDAALDLYATDAVAERWRSKTDQITAKP